MKTIFKLLLMFFVINIFGQNNNTHLNQFIGEWEAEFGQNQLFRLNLENHEGTNLTGYYTILTLNNNGAVLEEVSSKITFENGFTLPHTVFGWADNSLKAHGSVRDVTINPDSDIADRKQKPGDFTLTRISSNPVKAEWKVKRNKTGLQFLNEQNPEPENYSIPTDIILTKVE